MGMKCENDKDLMIAKRAVFCLVVPFILFLSGLVSASFFDSVVFRISAMVPLSVYVLFYVNFSAVESVRNCLLGVAYVATVALIFISVVYLLGVIPDFGWPRSFGNVALLNAPILFAFSAVGTFFETFDFRIRDMFFSDGH